MLTAKFGIGFMILVVLSTISTLWRWKGIPESPSDWVACVILNLLGILLVAMMIENWRKLDN